MGRPGGSLARTAERWMGGTVNLTTAEMGRLRQEEGLASPNPQLPAECAQGKRASSTALTGEAHQRLGLFPHRCREGAAPQDLGPLLAQPTSDGRSPRPKSAAPEVVN